jgi:hypothetical protein
VTLVDLAGRRRGLHSPPGPGRRAEGPGQPLIIENVGGVGGALGVQKVLGSTDGHHALLGSPLELIIPPLTNATVKYKPADLRMVALLVKAPFVLIARKDLPPPTSTTSSSRWRIGRRASRWRWPIPAPAAYSTWSARSSPN